MTSSSGSARSTRRAVPQRQRRIPPRAHAIPAPSPSNWTPIAHRFRAGSRIRVLIAGGSHPRFARNLGTGEPLLTGGGCGRRPTPCISATAHRGCGCPRAATAVSPLNRAPARRSRAASRRRAPASPTSGSTGSGTQLLQPAYSGTRASRTGSASGLTCTTSTVSRCLGRKSSRSARTDSAVQMCSRRCRRVPPAG